MTTLTLTDFLLARIVEEETLANYLLEHAEPIHEGGDFEEAVFPLAIWGSKRGDWDARIPARRLLAECAAKRRAVEHHAATPSGRHPSYDCAWCRMLWPCFDLRNVAAPYASHRDYRQEWKP